MSHERYTLTERKAFVLGLIKLRHLVRGGKELPHTFSGICYNIEAIAKRYDSLLYGMVRNYAEGWYNHSGDPNYPVGGYYEAWDGGALWKGEARRRRIELMDYLIEQASDGIDFVGDTQ